MSNAARELNVTPGAISRHMHALEESAGAVLFIRRAAGLEPTPAGGALAGGAREALDRTEEASTDVRVRHDRQLSVGECGHFLSRALLPILPSLRRELPQLEVDFHASTNPLDMLPSRFDAAIAVSGMSSQAGVIVQPPMPITTVAVAPPRRLETGTIDFANAPLLHTRPRSEHWRRWLDHAGLHTVPVRRGSTFESASQTLEAVAADLEHHPTIHDRFCDRLVG